MESAVKLDNDIVLFKSVAIVFVYCFQEYFELRLHTSTDRVAEDELLSLASKEVRFDHDFLMDKSGVKHLEIPKLLKHPVNHWLVPLSWLHDLDSARNLQQLVKILQIFAM